MKINQQEEEGKHESKERSLKGEGACPPEDCGGTWGYEALKEALADKKHPEHKEMKEWLGLCPKENRDAAAFDLEEHQQILKEYLV